MGHYFLEKGAFLKSYGPFISGPLPELFMFRTLSLILIWNMHEYHDLKDNILKALFLVDLQKFAFQVHIFL